MHVIVREVVGKNSCLGVTSSKIDQHVHHPTREINLVARTVGGSGVTDTHTVHRNIDRIRSNAASVVPIAASTRPQLGSLPKIAALNRLLRATERPTTTASSSLAAPMTSIRI